MSDLFNRSNLMFLNERKAMFYKKNVSSKERFARLIGGLLMIACGLVGLKASPLGLLVACVGVVTLVTGAVGYCPACAVGGRKPIEK